ncbi:carbamoyl phosphate synthase large subunit [Ignatzschineria ureiclastica]|uniref:Carbamoyl phosphate synthase large chain n=1 Tax=Ignatzschineria ureiclastica TaxID=472582 RepID=A0A2U2AHE2_9GAMM|nr:carbamoyl-phosphate synthase large subunit [Ignatzschineria ureiclastica]PWD82073.1 carbamoyl phosphate synthase large subunit [Ignatzschineria ureiclastica]GGZ92481.1 carbamoyl-phosphate synthase large chain [Ignatzschineria ureiclastica]
MPKRQDLQSILIIGAGPIVIGQACEFDYSGAQACKALKSEGFRVILVNSNPATIMTDPEMADATYIEPITWQTVAKIIEKERPDAILPTMGGQTALNCALDLSRNGILEQYNVEIIGATITAIDKAEDRGKFKIAMENIGLQCPKAFVVHSMAEAFEAQTVVGYPTLIRPSFTMGGTGGGIAHDEAEFIEICERGFEASPTHELLIEQSVLGWKEIEMEVIRDKSDHVMIVCSIENFDPMGVHTGDSITIAPAQTLTDEEYQLVRDATFAIIREIGVDTGGSNVQFAMNPANGELVVIEMNPRVSRSSALASKATGYPIAKITAKLAVGYTLAELDNDMIGSDLPATVEPAIDYVVTKVPRFAFEKFTNTNDRLTTQMKSVGEVMAMGRTFQESLQKALRGLETGLSGLASRSQDRAVIIRELKEAGPERILYVADALRIGMSIAEINQYSWIDPWFIAQLADLVAEEKALQDSELSDLTYNRLRTLKRKGFSDQKIADCLQIKEKHIRALRESLDLHPVYKRVDSCAGAFPTDIAYLYSTYEDYCEARVSDRRKVMILGGGPNRIGQGIEFDYCCVHASLALRESGFETIMVNCNPETVSTDFDISDRLYFEPLTLEDLLEIIRIEQPEGVIVHYGGQTPLKLAKALEENGVPIIGTSADSIDLAEDRARFQSIVNELALTQPENQIAYSEAEALQLASKVGYPLVVRPSYVLGGRAMQIVYSDEALQRYMQEAVTVTPNSPILLDHFLDHAIEVDVDAIFDGETLLVGGLMEHIEQAGVHSGDSASVLPPHSLSKDVQAEIIAQTEALAKALSVRGLMNVQYAVQDNIVYLLEVNPRASRTVPFVSKAMKQPLAKIAARVMAGIPLQAQNLTGVDPLQAAEMAQAKGGYAVKEAVFPFNKFSGIDVILGPEMRSTGEVMGIGQTMAEAYLKAQLGAGEKVRPEGIVFLSVEDRDKDLLPAIAPYLIEAGYTLWATPGTAKALQSSGFAITVVTVDEAQLTLKEAIKAGKVAMVINTEARDLAGRASSYAIRRAALSHRVPYYTTMAGAKAICESLHFAPQLAVVSLQDLASIA